MVGNRGQASLTDAIYFMLIVTGLSTFLFAFGVFYGSMVSEQLSLEYRSEYASSALKTILYSSTPRTAGEPLEEATEVDFLLAAMKEDFADDGEFNTVETSIVNNVVGLMEPLGDSFDYMYYIFIPHKQEFAFFLLYTGQFSWDSGRGNEGQAGQGDSVVYLCDPKTINKLDALVTNVGQIYQANSRMQLIKIKEGGGRGYDVFPSQVNLSMWTATKLPEVNGKSIVLDPDQLNCTCFRKLVQRNNNPGEWRNC